MHQTNKLPTTVRQPSHRKDDVVALRNCETGEEYPLRSRQGTVLVGCSNTCDIIVSERYVSKQHCALEQSRNHSWTIQDRGSKNGTLVNGVRVRTAELTAGSQLEIGDARLLVIGATARESTVHRGPLIGNAPAFRAALQLAEKAGRTNRASVLILGETGTGKELFARLIHDQSRRADKPFIPLNCGAIPKELINSELFGHVQGAFTGATSDRNGVFMQANGGTLFLDELGELPAEQQPYLLRALQSRLIRRVGGQCEEMVDTRVIAATNHIDLASNTSPLRSDLYHRLATIVIELPPLRERKEDIPHLIRHFVKAYTPEHGPRTLDERTISALTQHEWQGNVRELQCATERAMSLGAKHLHLYDFLPDGVIARGPSLPPMPDVNLSVLTPYQRNQRQQLFDAYDRRRSIRQAAREVGLPKSTFADLCKRYGIDTSRCR